MKFLLILKQRWIVPADHIFSVFVASSLFLTSLFLTVVNGQEGGVGGYLAPQGVPNPAYRLLPPSQQLASPPPLPAYQSQLVEPLFSLARWRIIPSTGDVPSPSSPPSTSFFESDTDFGDESPNSSSPSSSIVVSKKQQQKLKKVIPPEKLKGTESKGGDVPKNEEEKKAPNDDGNSNNLTESLPFRTPPSLGTAVSSTVMAPLGGNKLEAANPGLAEGAGVNRVGEAIGAIETSPRPMIKTLETGARVVPPLPSGNKDSEFSGKNEGKPPSEKDSDSVTSFKGKTVKAQKAGSPSAGTEKKLSKKARKSSPKHDPFELPVTTNVKGVGGGGIETANRRSLPEAPAKDRPLPPLPSVSRVNENNRILAASKSFPLETCYRNLDGFMCCNRELEQLMDATYWQLVRSRGGQWKKCNIDQVANAIQRKASRHFGVDFESVAGAGDYASINHFNGDLICKIRRESSFILAFATPNRVNQLALPVESSSDR